MTSPLLSLSPRTSWPCLSLAHALVVALFGCIGCSSGTPAKPSCENRGDEYFAGFSRTSMDGKVTVELVSAEPAPPTNSYTNAWTLRVTDATGARVAGALVVAAPYMVDHGHGAPNLVAKDLGEGTYLASPLSLKMNGLWSVTLKVTPAAGEESRVVMSFCVEPL